MAVFQGETAAIFVQPFEVLNLINQNGWEVNIFSINFSSRSCPCHTTLTENLVHRTDNFVTFAIFLELVKIAHFQFVGGQRSACIYNLPETVLWQFQGFASSDLCAKLGDC